MRIVNRDVSDKLGRYLTLTMAAMVVLITLALLAFVTIQGLGVTIRHGLPLWRLFTPQWGPDTSAALGGPHIGTLIFLTGSLLVSLLAVTLATPLALAAALFIAELAPRLGSRVLRPAMELFVGIPSVVYGWVGLSVLVPVLRRITGGTGFSLLAGGIVLAVMIMPTIASVSTDSLLRLTRELKEGALSLGSTRWQAIYHVILPAALPGALTGVVLGMARAFGESLAVQMVIGNVRAFPKSVTGATTTLTSVITMDMGNTIAGSLWNDALWGMALILLLTSIAFITLVRRLAGGGVRQ